MITVPQSTIEKPLTAIDYIAALAECRTRAELVDFAERCPDAVRADERFTKAVAGRLADIAQRRKRA